MEKTIEFTVTAVDNGYILDFIDKYKNSVREVYQHDGLIERINDLIISVGE